MMQRAESLRDEYYLIKMIPRPKVTKKVETETPKEPTPDEQVDLDDGESSPEPDAAQEEDVSEDEAGASDDEEKANG